MNFKILQLLLVVTIALCSTSIITAAASDSSSSKSKMKIINAHLFKNLHTGDLVPLTEEELTAGITRLGTPISTVNVTTPQASLWMNNSLNISGWDEITVTANRDLLKSNPKEAYYKMGFLEGYYTAEGINAIFYTHVALWQSFPQNFLDFFDQNIAAMMALGEQEKDKTLQGTSVYRFMSQMQGIADGYNENKRNGWLTTDFLAPYPDLFKGGFLTFRDIYLMNAAAEFSDVTTALLKTVKKESPEAAALEQFAQSIIKRNRPSSHCSALVRLAKDDLFSAHVTWNNFEAFLRQFKTYNYETTVAFSTEYARISSGDDWYYTGQKLLVTETTLIMDNATLTQEFVRPDLILYFLRIMASNVWTDNAKDYFSEFLVQQSGTYCNQNILVDFKLVNDSILESQKLVFGTVAICEQLPGPYSATFDVSDIVSQQGFWSSFNIAYNPRVYKMSLNEQLCQNGSIFCANNYSRKLIFERDAPKVETIEDMQTIMRYNNINDPLQQIPNCDDCNPKYSTMLGIASRGDLVEQNASFGNYSSINAADMSYAVFGALDAKIGSFRMTTSGNFESSIISGPTRSHGLKTFAWNEQTNALQQSVRGMPERYEFPFLAAKTIAPFNLTWKEYVAGLPPAKNDGLEWVWGVAFGVAIVGFITGFLIWKKRLDQKEKGDGAYESVQQSEYKQAV